MTFSDAKEIRMPFGKFKGESFDKIAETDDGLLYLDWLRGEKIHDRRLRSAVEAYLDDPAIKAELAKL